MVQRYLIVVCGVLMLAGCGGSGGVNKPTAAGTVVAADFPAGQLSVGTMQAESAQVSSSGNFEVEVAGKKPQLAILKLASGAPAGLAPVMDQSGQVISAESTALALLFLTPGITPLNQATLEANRTKLLALPEFQEFVATIRPALKSGGLAAATALEDYNAKFEAVVAAWNTPAAQASADDPVPDYDAGVTAKVDSTDPSHARLSMENAGWRCSEVLVEGDKLSGSVVEPNPFSIYGPTFSMTSTVTGVWNMFHGQTPITETAYHEMNLAGADGYTEVRLWMIGPGSGGPDLPASLPAATVANARTRAGLDNVLTYVVSPLISFCGGNDSVSTLRDLSAILAADTDVQLATIKLLDGISSGDSAAAKNYALALFDAALPRVVDYLIAHSTGSWVRLLQSVATILNPANKVIAAANFSLAVYYWISLPAVSEFVVAPTGGVHVEVQ